MVPRQICILVILKLFFDRGISSLENVALRRPAFQKSYLTLDNRAWRAVDGVVHNDSVRNEGCAVTGDPHDSDAWWEVDLGGMFLIDSVKIYNMKAGYHRLRDFWIRVGNTRDINDHIACAFMHGWIASGVSETFNCSRTLFGRWVSIQRTNDYGDRGQYTQGFLQLCEVQVYGSEYTGSTASRIVERATTASPTPEEKATTSSTKTSGLQTVTLFKREEGEGSTAAVVAEQDTTVTSTSIEKATTSTRKISGYATTTMITRQEEEVTVSERGPFPGIARAYSPKGTASTAVAAERTSVMSPHGVASRPLTAWPMSAVATAIVLGIAVVLLVIYVLIIHIRRHYTCTKKETRQHEGPSANTNGVSHLREVHELAAVSNEYVSAGEDKHYELLNTQQATPPEPRYEVIDNITRDREQSGCHGTGHIP